MAKSTQAYQIGGITYRIASHRDASGHFATWRCATCGSAGGKTGIYADLDSALAAVDVSIEEHQSRRHPTLADHSIFALVYCSQAVNAVGRESLDELARHAAEKNERLNVTGYLTYDVEFETFFQFLEGPRSVVQTLMEVIRCDFRHRVLNIVPITEAERQFAIASAYQQSARTESTPGEQRMFPTWRMQLVTGSDFKSMNMDELLADILTKMRRTDLAEEDVTRSVLELSTQLRSRARFTTL